MTAATPVRLDRAAPLKAGGLFVKADATELPFPDSTFKSAIANHSLEHIDDLNKCLREIGRVVKPDGALFVSIPDSSTLTDRIYRWLARGGGHVNAFTSASELTVRIERATGLAHIATKSLCSSLSFLNRRNSPKPYPWKLMLVGGGFEWPLFLYSFFSRRLDRAFGLRSSVYGWALYFGRINGEIDIKTWLNVCVRCGEGCPSTELIAKCRVRSSIFGIRTYRCMSCDAVNSYADDF